MHSAVNTGKEKLCPRARPLSLGFIGGGCHSAVGYAHYVACRMDGLWSLDAGCFSLDQEENIRTGEMFGLSPKRVYPTWKALVRGEKRKLDALVILTPTPAHYEITMECLAAGIPVICEKALVSNSEQAERILMQTRTDGNYLAVTFNYSGYPMIRELRSMIRKERLGNICHFEAEMPQEGFRRVDELGNCFRPQEWRLKDACLPTIYLDLGVHLHQLVDYLICARPLEVCADHATYGWFDVVDDVSAICRYERGIRGRLWFSKSALGYRNGLRIRIFGTEGSAEWIQSEPENLLFAKANGERLLLDRGAGLGVASQARFTRFKAGHPAGFIEAFANLYADLAGSLREHKIKGRRMSDEVSGAELSFQGLRMMEALVASTRSGQWEKVILE